MKHYEIVLIVNVTQEDRLTSLCQRHKELVQKHQGQLHRFENWGRRQLCHPIRDCAYATYLLYNIEAPMVCVEELVRQFRINDAVLRHMLIRRDEAISGKSIMKEEAEATELKQSKERSSSSSDRPRRSTPPYRSAGDKAAKPVESAKAAGKPAEAAQTDKPADKPAEVAQTDKPADKPAEAAQAEKPAGKPAEAAQTDKPADKPAEKPAEVAQEESADDKATAKAAEPGDGDSTPDSPDSPDSAISGTDSDSSGKS